MSREIKFRAWVGNRMYYWGFIDDGHGYSFHGLPSSNQEPLSYADLQERSMQFTGLHDRHGKEIYENDVIRYREGMYDDWYTGEITYHGDRGYPAFDVGPTIDCDSNGLSYIMACCECEVIGNIWEDSHLLEGGKE